MIEANKSSTLPFRMRKKLLFMGSSCIYPKLAKKLQKVLPTLWKA